MRGGERSAHGGSHHAHLALPRGGVEGTLAKGWRADKADGNGAGRAVARPVGRHGEALVGIYYDTRRLALKKNHDRFLYQVSLLDQINRDAGKGDGWQEAALRSALVESEKNEAAAVEELKRQFPRYLELAAPAPLTLAEAKRLLEPGSTLADPQVLRRALQPLPESRGEILALADAIQAPATHLYFGQGASERRVKEMDLSRFRFLAFGTHGIMAAELKGLVEPALALTPPESASPLDDGLLKASEIAQLKLDADLAILSACNTAALLATAMMRRYRAAPAEGRAQAMRTAMLALMSDARHPEYAHPFFWAPFLVVGEGR